MFLNMQVICVQVEILVVTSNVLVAQVSINGHKLANWNYVIQIEPISNADLSSLIRDSNSKDFSDFLELWIFSLLEMRYPRGVRLVKLSST